MKEDDTFAPMEPWAAWQGTRGLSFLHDRIRQLLVRQGVADGFIDIQGNPVHYYAAGPADAPRTVVLLHGLGDSANNWFRTLPLLAWRGDRVVAIDLPGHGFSRPHDERGFLHVREHASVVRQVVERLGAGNDVDVREDDREATPFEREIALVGHSLGGWVAARAHLDGLKANRLVLVEAAGLAYEGMWDAIELLRIEQEEDVRRFFRTICHSPPFALSLLSKEVTSMFRSPAVVNFINNHSREDIIQDAELDRVSARTTVIWGECDGLIPPIIAHRWHGGIPGSKLVWIPKCGHAPQFERPLLFQQMIEEALGHPPLGQHLKNRLRTGIVGRLPESVVRRFSLA